MSVTRQNQISLLSLIQNAEAYLGALKEAWHSARQQLSVYAERRRARHCLATMSKEMLDDIGISSFEAQAEAQQKFWRQHLL